jgi:hypothetical protein
VSLRGRTFIPLWPERVRISRPCSCSPLAPPDWKCQILASRSGFGALQNRLPAEGCVRGGVYPRPPTPYTGSARLDPAPGAPDRRLASPLGLSLWSLEWRRGVLCVKLEEEANRVPLAPSPSCPKQQGAGCGLQRFLRVAREDSNIPKTARRRRNPSAWGQHSRSAECGTVPQRAPLTDRLLPPLHPGCMECVLWGGVGGLVNFNICAAPLFGLWRGTDISAMFFTSGCRCRPRDERSGGRGGRL